ncbi:hypothetical protein NIES593_19170 [Hydrococcus rivularis NIES-593]|uniref:Uncharacterized protein n=1 Tax=Hydrococcus rivularis NIES-593 TaxID=1921803 RepID=A0A1U7H9S2_9CYAN|nr:hypothetical protein [Hydrococcus rivularis]OKH20347.1 hypothetical protein NIES593_19170 [Hydrococcus rivularis NIES-593]
MHLLIETYTNTPHFPVAATLSLIVGFIAATTIGSIAWYNSKRPVGWENKERPDVVPELDTSDTVPKIEQ